MEASPAFLRYAQADQLNVNSNELEQNRQLSERWEALSLPGDSHTSNAFSSYLQVFSKQRNVLNCAIPLPRAKSLTDFELPDGVTLQDCMTASVTGSFPASYKEAGATSGFWARTSNPSMTPGRTR